MCVQKTCTWMCSAALFIIAETWRQPRRTSEGEWINWLWYTQRTDYSGLSHQAMKSHGGNLHAFYQVKGPNLKALQYFMITTIRHSGKVKWPVISRSYAERGENRCCTENSGSENTQCDPTVIEECLDISICPSP